MEILEKCKILEYILTSEQTNSKDFDAIQLSDKLEVFASSVKKIRHRGCLLQHIIEHIFS